MSWKLQITLLKWFKCIQNLHRWQLLILRANYVASICILGWCEQGFPNGNMTGAIFTQGLDAMIPCLILPFTMMIWTVLICFKPMHFQIPCDGYTHEYIMDIFSPPSNFSVDVRIHGTQYKSIGLFQKRNGKFTRTYQRLQVWKLICFLYNKLIAKIINLWVKIWCLILGMYFIGASQSVQPVPTQVVPAENYRFKSLDLQWHKFVFVIWMMVYMK